VINIDPEDAGADAREGVAWVVTLGLVLGILVSVAVYAC
jgi:hypothetical protein